mmetsp:Transcript_35213/g.73304  ORF Transcript_35213/g.73304 Transcript_35213/m.73304 type:complete len:207 (+) Transcript_35213:1017-1637(+)
MNGDTRRCVGALIDTDSNSIHVIIFVAITFPLPGKVKTRNNVIVGPFRLNQIPGIVWSVKQKPGQTSAFTESPRIVIVFLTSSSCIITYGQKCIGISFIIVRLARVKNPPALASKTIKGVVVTTFNDTRSTNAGVANIHNFQTRLERFSTSADGILQVTFHGGYIVNHKRRHITILSMNQQGGRAPKEQRPTTRDCQRSDLVNHDD